MIDLDAFVNAARKPWYCRSEEEENILSPEYISSMSIKLLKAEKDAARYRWLRDDAKQEFINDTLPSTIWSQWDKAIDKAMQCNK